jgi:hypothetical protein
MTTTNKGLIQPANGSYVDTWDQPVNNDWSYIDTAFGGVTSLNATGVSAVTLTLTQYQPMAIAISGAISNNVTYTIPSGVGGNWIVRNTTTDATGGPWTVTFASGGGGSTVTVIRSVNSNIWSDGTNMYFSDSRPAVAAGSNTQVQYNNSGFLAGSSSFTFDGTDVSINSGGLKFPDNTVQTTAAGFPSGTKMFFYQSAAPTGWTQITTLSDFSLRVVSGTGGVSAGSIGMSTMFSGTYNVGDTALSVGQLPAHSHSVTDLGHYHGISNLYATNANFGSGGSLTGWDPAATPNTSHNTDSVVTGITIDNTGGSGTHTHTIPALKYLDTIICTKD